jgi:hypothetical protein
MPTSARLSLFPSANVSRAPSPRLPAAQRVRPLQRAKTAPGLSPHRQSFPKQPQEQPEEDAQAPSQALNGNLGETANPALTPRSHASTPSRRSFDSEVEEITIAVSRNTPGQTWKPRAEHLSPHWEMVTKPMGSPVTKASALRSHPSTRQPSSAPLEPASPVARSPGLSRSKSQILPSPKPQSLDGPSTTLGIARSVSVSRANKPAALLKSGFLSPNSGGRFVDGSKPLTPTLVELSNRKSQRVQLVDA